MTYEVAIGGRTYKIELQRPNNSSITQQSSETKSTENAFSVHMDGRAVAADCVRVGDSFSLIIDGKAFDVRVEHGQDNLRVSLGGKTYECSVRNPRSLRTARRAAGTEGGPQKLSASMPGKVVRVLVRAGDPVTVGQGILVIEAMKMQNEVRSPGAGVLKSLSVKEGANVNAGEILAIIE